MSVGFTNVVRSRLRRTSVNVIRVCDTCMWYVYVCHKCLWYVFVIRVCDTCLWYVFVIRVCDTYTCYVVRLYDTYTYTYMRSMYGFIPCVTPAMGGSFGPKRSTPLCLASRAKRVPPIPSLGRNRARMGIRTCAFIRRKVCDVVRSF